MKRLTILAAILALPPVLGAQKGTDYTLARVRSQFASADRDKSGTISLSEALAAGHSRAEFSFFDADASGAIDSDEFTLGYRELGAARGRRIASDLENETTRIKNQRKAKKAVEKIRERNAGNERGPSAQRLANKARNADPTPARVRDRFREGGTQSNSTAATGARSRALNKAKLALREGDATRAALPRVKSQARANGVTKTSAKRALRSAPQGANAQAPGADTGTNAAAPDGLRGVPIAPTPARIRNKLMQPRAPSLSAERLASSVRQRRLEAETVQRTNPRLRQLRDQELQRLRQKQQRQNQSNGSVRRNNGRGGATTGGAGKGGGTTRGSKQRGGSSVKKRGGN
ncbi:MAG: hypothetical protein O7B99_06815 [Planctomycetota bacterium]|nr:hypothetical protein [Planctomycetota bacterium]